MLRTDTLAAELAASAVGDAVDTAINNTKKRHRHKSTTSHHSSSSGTSAIMPATSDQDSDYENDGTSDQDSVTARLLPGGNVSRSENRWRMPTRYVFVLMGFLGFNMLYALRVNLSVAMVTMVNSTAAAATGNQSTPSIHQCFNKTAVDLERAAHRLSAGTTGAPPGEFAWDSYTQGVVMGSFFWGYMITQVPGGRLAESWGSKRLLAFSIFFTSLLTIISPWAARLSYVAFMLTRAAEGMCEGVAFPSMHAMIARWLPKNERGLMSTFVYSGAQIGTVITMPMTGLIASSTALGGWASAFYVHGVIGCIWIACWMALVYETPSDHPRIRRTELKYILDGQGAERAHRNPTIPWKRVLTSGPLWALIIAHMGQNWGFYTILFQLPTYFSQILGFDVTNNGFLSALPYLLQAMVGWVAGFFFEYLIKNNILEINTIRKLSNTIGFVGPAVCLYLVTLVKCDATWSVVLFILAMGFNGFVYSGCNVTHVDMAPDFAGTLMGITNCLATIPGIAAPYVVGVLLKQENSLESWAKVFYISSSIYVVAAIVFVLFGSARLQPWGVAKGGAADVGRSVDA